ncbi:MAG: UDP-N-acetylmuramate--L-alanine ligase, partial [Chitinophagaceae bacterium]
RYFHSKGVKVSGYDKTSTTLTKDLEESGLAIHYEENVDLIPKDAQLVVYTPAVPKDHKELAWYRQQGAKVVKRSDVLQMISESSINICIAGTHGKTTITTMVAHLLRDTGFGCNAFLGGISVNYGTNFWSDPKNVCVIEADEYDRSFLKLSPDIAIITAMDADHLDIYGDAASVEQAFIDFSKKIKPGGLLIRQFDLKRGKELSADRQLTYSFRNESADVYATNIRMMNGSYEFDVVMKDTRIDNVVLNMGGLHNVENVIAAIAAASSLGIEKDKIKAAVEAFRGVKRRFEYIVKNENPVFIDDYAHHPEELRALITGAKSLFKGKKCTVIFQPHLFTRTRDFADGFAEVLDMADEVFLLPIYPARELPIDGVTSEMLVNKMQKGKAVVVSKEEVLKILENKKLNADTPELLITAGAGDIDTLVFPIKELLLKPL